MTLPKLGLPPVKVFGDCHDIVPVNQSLQNPAQQRCLDSFDVRMPVHEGEVAPCLCDGLSAVEERTVSMDGELEQVEMVIFSGDLTAEEKMECGVLLVSGYTVTPLWERIQSQ